jgi:hypothetical protein
MTVYIVILLYCVKCVKKSWPTLRRLKNEYIIIEIFITNTPFNLLEDKFLEKSFFVYFIQDLVKYSEKYVSGWRTTMMTSAL